MYTKEKHSIGFSLKTLGEMEQSLFLFYQLRGWLEGSTGSLGICTQVMSWLFRDLVQLARTPALGAGGHKFESCNPDDA